VSGDVQTDVVTADDPSSPANARPSGRRRRWDRPPEPHDWRWVVGGVGKVMISVGILMFGFVAYQLWGTGVSTARAQNRLENEFEQLLAQSPAVSSTVASTPASSAPPTSATPPESSPVPAATVPPVDTTPPPPPTAPSISWTNGSAVARIEIPSIGVDDIVVEGVRTGDLKAGPGHFPESPMPGQLGNAAVAGHRTTYGAPFGNIDKVRSGDEIVFTVPTGRFVYAVTAVEIVDPSDYSSVVPAADPNVASVTLVSCHPEYTAKQRIIVRGELVASASPAPLAPPANLPEPQVDAELPPEELPGGDPTAPSTTPLAAPTGSADSAPTSTAVAADQDEPAVVIADPLAAGWFSDDGAWPQVALWGLALAAIGIGASFVSRSLRRNWVGALAGIAPFLGALWFFYENVIRLLPAAI
jgi:sortase A